MDQASLIELFINNLDHQKVIKLNLEWLDGRQEDIYFEPYLIGESQITQWTFLYGRISGKKQLLYIPFQYIIGFETTFTDFSVDTQKNTFLISDTEKHAVIKCIQEVSILDISSPEKLNLDNITICPFCKSEYNCEHLVLEYDLSFNEFKSGSKKEFDEMLQIVNGVFLRFLNEKKDFIIKPEGAFGMDPDKLQSLWDDAKGNFEFQDDKDIVSESLLIRVIEILFYDYEDATTFFQKCYPEGSYAPGFDSVMLGYYAKNPSDILKSIPRRLIDYFDETQYNHCIALTGHQTYCKRITKSQDFLCWQHTKNYFKTCH